MPVTRLNHAVLYVRDADSTARFFVDNLDFEIAARMQMGPGRFGVFVKAGGSPNDHDLGLFSVGADALPSAAGRGTVGMYHLAWEVPTLAELAAYKDRLSAIGALAGMSDHGVSKSLYVQDPDGLEFELLWAVPPELLDESDNLAAIAPLDLDAEIRRFGADTPGRKTF